MAATDLTVDVNLSRFYQDHHPWLLNWLEKRVACRLHAEDHAHDTFMRVIEFRDTHEIREPRAYLTTIAKGLLINHWRKSAIEQAYLDKIATYPEALIIKQGKIASAVNHALKKHGKIRKFRFRDYSSNNEKSFKISQNLSIGTKEKLILGGAKNA